MPTFRITAPDGKTFDVTGPEGSTQEQALAQVQAQYKPQQASQPQPQPQTPNVSRDGQPISPNQVKGSTLGGIYMGLRDPIDAGAQLLTRMLPDSVVQAGNKFNNALVDLGVPGIARLEGPDAPNLSGLVTGQQSSASSPVDRMVRTANDEYQASRQMAGRDGIDLARIGGNVLNPINRIVPFSGAGSTAAVAGRAATQGAITGLATPVLTNDDFAKEKLFQVGLGATVGGAAGAAFNKLAEAAGKGVASLQARPGFPAWLGGKSNTPVDAQARQVLSEAAREGGFDLSKVPQSILEKAQQEVSDALKSGASVDTKALGRATLGKAVLGEDAALMTGQMTRDPMKFANELNLRGVEGAGKPIADRLALQNERLIDAVQKRGAAGAPDNYDAGSISIKSLQDLDKKLSSEVSDAYQKFRTASGTTINVPMQPVAQKLGDVVETYGKENIPSAVMQRLNSYGLMGGKQTKVFDLLEADKLIKVINANYDPMRATEARALGDLRRGLSEAIDLADKQSQGATGPAATLLQEALGKAKARFGLHESVPGLEAASQNRATQEAFVQQYITSKSAGIDTVEGMVKLLSPDALDAVKKNVLSNILESAAPGATRGSDAAKFSQAGFRKALDNIGDRKLKILFGDEGLQQLRQIENVSQWIQAQPAGSAVNNSATASAMMNLLSKVGGYPGVNIARDSVKKFSQERAANNALKAVVPTQKINVSPEELNALKRFVMPLSTATTAAAESANR